MNFTLYAQEIKIIRDLTNLTTPNSPFRHANNAVEDTIKKEKENAVEEKTIGKEKEDPDFSVIKGKGNGTFSDAPNTLARIFTSNATVESIVATFPYYIAYYANDKYTDRRQRSYNVNNGRKQYYDITLEYDAKTRKVKTIIIDDPYTDKFKQKLLNAGYRWDSDSSMTATSFGHGYRSYWKKKGSRVYFVFNDRTIKVFRTD